MKLPLKVRPKSLPAVVQVPPISAERSAAYDNIDRFLRNNLDDTDYDTFSRDLETVLAAPLPAVVQVPQDVVALLDDVIDHAWNDGVLRKDKLMDDRTLAARQKLLDALAAAPEAPAPLHPAYRIAPVDPTMEMIDAGAQRLVSWGESSVWPDSWDALQVEAARTEADRCWRSMILAAPEAPAQEKSNG